MTAPLYSHCSDVFKMIVYSLEQFHLQEQYIELYNALLESFCSRSSVVSRDTFMNDVQTLQNSQASLPNWIEIQFKVTLTLFWKEWIVEEGRGVGYNHCFCFPFSALVYTAMAEKPF